LWVNSALNRQAPLGYPIDKKRWWGVERPRPHQNGNGFDGCSDGWEKKKGGHKKKKSIKYLGGKSGTKSRGGVTCRKSIVSEGPRNLGKAEKGKIHKEKGTSFEHQK